MTLIELLVTLLILSIGILTTIASYRYISSSLQHSKGRAVANRLAEEQIEKLKNLSYYSLLVTTDTYSDTHFSPALVYDTSNYPSQTMVQGGTVFYRTTRIDFAFQQGSSISTAPWSGDDTGLKELTIYVIWNEFGEWKYIEMRNLLASPKAVSLTSTLQGTVQNNLTVPLTGVLIQAVGHPNWQTYSDASGNYTFNVSPGSYTLMASQQGYGDQTSPYLNALSGASVTTPFTMTPYATGSATGNVYREDHVVISAVATATDTAGGFNTEYVELYNPTPNAVNMGVGNPSQAGYGVAWKSGLTYYNSTNVPSFSYLTYVSTFIPAYSYYLIANSPVVHVAGLTRMADATYSAPAYSYTNGAAGQNFMAPAGQMITPLQDGGVIIQINYPGNGWISDGVSWGGLCPTAAEEFACFPQAGGIGLDQVLLRKTDPHVSLLAVGRAYDSNDNSQDWLSFSPVPAAPYTALSGVVMPAAGTPALGAEIEVNDPLSTPATCTGVVLTAGHPPAYCSYLIPNIATGTWTMDIVSTGTAGSFVEEYSNVTIQPSISTGVPNGNTTPAWQIIGSTNALVDSSTGYAIVVGTIYDLSSNPLAHIKVTDGLGRATYTDANGRYSLVATAGVVTLSANSNDRMMNHSYATLSLNAVLLSPGQYYDGTTWGGNGSDFYLPMSGTVLGYFQTASGMALPGQAVLAFDAGGTQVQQAVSDNTGVFYLTHLTTGTYTIQPALDPAQSASPLTATVVLASTGTATFVSTFTVASAESQITGQVLIGVSNTPISGGVLLVASTDTISSALPPSMAGADGPLCSPCYYSGTSDASGIFSINVRSNSAPYQLYGWYTDFSSGSPVTTKAGPFSLAVNSGGLIVSQDISW